MAPQKITIKMIEGERKSLSSWRGGREMWGTWWGAHDIAPSSCHGTPGKKDGRVGHGWKGNATGTLELPNHRGSLAAQFGFV